MKSLAGVRVNAKQDAATFTVDTRIYPIDGVLGTAYVFINRAYVYLDQPTASGVRVTLSGKEPLGKEGVQRLCGEFLNELLGQVLRERLAKKHGKVRDALLAKALFAAAPGLVEVVTEAAAGEAPVAADQSGPAPEAPAIEPSLDDLPAEGDDFLDDPLGIAVPWEEKYGSKQES